MNTPKSRKSKRFNIDDWREAYLNHPLNDSGTYSMAIANQEVAIEFALLVSEFTHLEYAMERVMARLLGTVDNTASHVMRSIVSAKARVDLMKLLLERSRLNAAKPDSFDAIIDEFWNINQARNRYVHARYQTNDGTGQVYVIFPNKDPLVVDDAAMKEFNLPEMASVRLRISKLWSQIYQAYFEDVQQMHAPE